MKERGLLIIKPDGILLGEVGVVSRKIEDEGLIIAERKPAIFTPQKVRKFYANKQDHLSPFWEGYLCEEPSLALIVDGEDACRKLHDIKVETRISFGHDGFYTGTHASDSPLMAVREMEILFGKEGVSKRKLLESYGIEGGDVARKINGMINQWYQDEGLVPSRDRVADIFIPALEKAIPFWLNLTESEEGHFRSKGNEMAFYSLLRRVCLNGEPISFHGILCPSYKKGVGAVGFAEKPGRTTHRAFANLQAMVDNARELGIACTSPLMLLSDVDIENWQKLTPQDKQDFSRIAELDREIAETYGIDFMLSSEFDPSLLKSVGRGGQIPEVLEIEDGLLKKCQDRDRNFYTRNFGWTIEEADRRTLTHAHAYAMEAVSVRERLPNPVMVYSAYDYEKARFSNGKDGKVEPCIVYPRRPVDNNPNATVIKLRKE